MVPKALGWQVPSEAICKPSQQVFADQHQLGLEAVAGPVLELLQVLEVGNIELKFVLRLNELSPAELQVLLLLMELKVQGVMLLFEGLLQGLSTLVADGELRLHSRFEIAGLLIEGLEIALLEP